MIGILKALGATNWSIRKIFLFYAAYIIGIGLFWGEGNKMNKNSVRLGNTDPELILCFLDFMKRCYHIDISRLRFGIQIFSDSSAKEALHFWSEKLQVPDSQFQKVVITESGKIGTYRNKNTTGVLTIYFSNTKLRDTICDAIHGGSQGPCPLN